MRLRCLLIVCGMVFCVVGWAQETVNGVGSTFAAPLYQRWGQEYNAATGNFVNYQPLGSGAGIKYIIARYTDFGATDAPMSASDMAAAPGVVHVPMAAGPVVVAYNVPGIGPGIHLTGDVIAGIFLGDITNWSDPRVTRLSPGTRFPNLTISVFHRLDSSGTTSLFTNFLSGVSPTWKRKVGAGRALLWPQGTGARGNLGVAQGVKQRPGGIGYVEMEFAIQQAIFYAAVQNSQGRFIYPDRAAQAATVAAAELPSDLRVPLIATHAANGYPITGFTYILVYGTGTKPAVKSFLEWALTNGQKDAAEMGYVPLPPNIQKRALAVVAALK